MQTSEETWIQYWGKNVTRSNAALIGDEGDDDCISDKVEKFMTFPRHSRRRTKLGCYSLQRNTETIRGIESASSQRFRWNKNMTPSERDLMDDCGGLEVIVFSREDKFMSAAAAAEPCSPLSSFGSGPTLSKIEAASGQHASFQRSNSSHHYRIDLTSYQCAASVGAISCTNFNRMVGSVENRDLVLLNY